MTSRKIWGMIIASLLAVSIGVLAAEATRPVERVITHPIIVRVKGSGVMTDAKCAHVPKGITYRQVIGTYGWPWPVPKAHRDGFSSQETDGWEMDYPIASSLHAKFVRFCGVAFATYRGSVHHTWEDMP